MLFLKGWAVVGLDRRLGRAELDTLTFPTVGSLIRILGILAFDNQIKYTNK